MKKHYIFFIAVMVILLTGCGLTTEKYSQIARVDDIKTIYIDHGSTNLLLKSADQQNIEASHNKREVALDKSDEQITLGVEKKMLNIGPKLKKNTQFEVIIPDDFKGKVVINGSSGNISSDQLSTSNLDIVTKSGNVSIVFADFHSDVHIVTTSGNVELMLNEEQPDVQLTSETGSGSNIIALPIPISQDEKKIEVISGEGSFDIDIKTTSGDITVR